MICLCSHAASQPHHTLDLSAFRVCVFKDKSLNCLFHQRIFWFLEPFSYLICFGSMQCIIQNVSLLLYLFLVTTLSKYYLLVQYIYI